jgi:fimbrial chaperone protein
MRQRPALIAIVCGLLAGSGVAAAAGTLQIGPISTTLVGQERTSTVTIRNADTAPVTIQIRAMDWIQRNGEDVHTPSTTLVVSPPFATLQPDEAQTVRLLVDNVPTLTTERAFRLVIDEVPNTVEKTGVGVKTTLRMLAPVFLSPSIDARPRLTWSTARTANGLTLTARNEGDVHERLSNVKISARGRVIAEGATFGGYVLARSSRSWTLPAASGATEVTISGDGVLGPVNVRAGAAR